VTELAGTRGQLALKMVIKQKKNNVKNFHGSLTTVVRTQNDTSKTANITFSILHVERYIRPYQRSHAANCDETDSSV